MALTPRDWQAIYREMDKAIAQASQTVFVQGPVIKADKGKKLIWLKDFGDQPIPIFGFRYKVKYYDTQPTGVSGTTVNTQLQAKTLLITPECPQVGDIVLVAKQFGSRRLPKCLGILWSRDFEALSE